MKFSSEFEQKYPVAATEYQNATKLLEMGIVIGSLTSARVSLEAIVKAFCKQCSADTSDTNPEITLLDMIDALKENGVVSEQETSLLHRTRIICNKGAHPGEVMPELADAQEAVKLLSTVLEFMEEKDVKVDFDQRIQGNNRPMVRSDYYSVKRRYRGEWSECYTHEALAVIPEYVELTRRADSGDISAMLDLAIGFVSKDPVWSPNQLICMPKYRSRGREYYQINAYDARYYYWITRACDQAIAEVLQGGTYPKKYMANAFMDAMKFAVSIRAEQLEFFVCGVEHGQNSSQDQMLYHNQYQLVEELYGFNLNTLYRYSFCWARELMHLVFEAETCDIISDLHRQENTVEGIRYLAYCFCCMKHYCDMYAVDQGGCGMLDCVLDHEMAVWMEDIGAEVTVDLLAKRIPEEMRSAGYLQITSNFCKMIAKDVDKRNNHPKQVAVETACGKLGDKIRHLASEYSIVHEAVCCASILFMMVPIMICFLLFEATPPFIVFLLAMPLMVVCTALQDKLTVFFNSISTPYNWRVQLHNVIEKGRFVLLGFFLLSLQQIYQGTIAKLIMVATLIICVYVTGSVRGLLRMPKKLQKK